MPSFPSLLEISASIYLLFGLSYLLALCQYLKGRVNVTYIDSMMTGIDPQESLLTETMLIGCLVVVVLLVAYQRYRKHYSQRRLAAVRNRPVSNIEHKQIIIALELDGLFVDVSDHKQEGFSKVHIEQEGVDKLVGRVKDVLGMGVYFRPKASIRTMKALLHKLTSQSRVELYIYTRLNLSTADAILSELGLERHFPPSRRCSCSDLYNQSLKHPTELDFNTKRVVIVTNSPLDHLSEDSKYFLTLRRAELATSINLIASLVASNRNIDLLHNELSELKVFIESDEETS